MRVKELIPSLYENNVEMQALYNSQEIELDTKLKQYIDNKFLDTFASKATLQGIEQFEEMFSIQADPINESLEFRRARIMNRIVSSLPYTERYLINKLNTLLGENNWRYTIDYAKYQLKIYSLIPGKSWYRELQNLLSQIIPVNIDWEISVYAATWGIVKDSFSTWNDIKDMTWQELEDAEWSS